MTVQGFLEKASFDVPHLDAGAGDGGLLAQLFLGILTVVCVVVWAFVEPHWTRKLLGAGLVVVTAALFLVCARGLQRFAPGFSESAFEQLQTSHHSGSGLVSAEVTARLGEPLIRQRLPGGGETWLYSDRGLTGPRLNIQQIVAEMVIAG